MWSLGLFLASSYSFGFFRRHSFYIFISWSWNLWMVLGKVLGCFWNFGQDVSKCLFSCPSHVQTICPCLCLCGCSQAEQTRKALVFFLPRRAVISQISSFSSHLQPNLLGTKTLPTRQSPPFATENHKSSSRQACILEVPRRPFGIIHVLKELYAACAAHGSNK